MLDENQSLRINFEGFVETVQVLLQANALYIKNQNTRTTDHHELTTAAIEAPVAIVPVMLKLSPFTVVIFSGRRTSQKVFCPNLSCSSNRKKDHPPLEIPTGSAARVRIT